MEHSDNEQLAHIWPVTCHTDHVGPGSTFVAIKGFNVDGLQFIPLALAKGARHIVVQEAVELDFAVRAQIEAAGAICTYVPDTRIALAQLSAQAHDYPAHKLRLLAVTGTKGKTTTAHLTFAMLRSAGIKAALISTVGNYVGTTWHKPSLTTPQADYLHMFFAHCVMRGITHVVLEVAAQALVMHRVYGLEFHAAAWTNMEQEHMEFFGTMDAYMAAKTRIRSHLACGVPLLVNGDDKRLRELVATKEQPITYYVMPAGAVRSVYPQLELVLDNRVYVAPKLIGYFNAYNVLCARQLAYSVGVTDEEIAHALAVHQGIPGRMQPYALPNGAYCYSDDAHTPASYEQVLKLVRNLTDHLVVVFGCVGRRDPSKRPKMTRVVAMYADQAIITADNPGDEPFATICADMMSSLTPVQSELFTVIADRQEAIVHAYRYTRKGSIIVLFGKSVDTYQLLGNQRIAYNEAALITTVHMLSQKSQ